MMPVRPSLSASELARSKEAKDKSMTALMQARVHRIPVVLPPKSWRSITTVAMAPVEKNDSGDAGDEDGEEDAATTAMATTPTTATRTLTTTTMAGCGPMGPAW